MEKKEILKDPEMAKAVVEFAMNVAQELFVAQEKYMRENPGHQGPWPRAGNREGIVNRVIPAAVSAILGN